MDFSLNYWLVIPILSLIFVSESVNFEQSLSKLELLGMPLTIRDFIDDWNFFVRVECQKSCGGVLIHPKWVLAAADCIASDKIQCVVRLGAIYLDDINGDESIRIPAAKIILHPFLELEASNGFKIHNIGLVLLQNRVRLSRKVNLVTVPDDIPWEAENCQVVSWGGDIFPISLYQVALKNASFQACDQLLKLMKNREAAVDNICDMFGISYSEKDTGLTSMLHSGAALVCHNYFYGILNSTGFSAENGYFLAWNYLLGYLEWINEQLKEHNDRPIQVLRIKSFENITDPKLTLRTKKSTISTTDRAQMEGRNIEKKLYIDPFEIYINQTLRGKKNLRRYNPRFRKLNTFLRKQESDNDLTYEEFDEVETNTVFEILPEKKRKRKKSRKDKREKRKKKKFGARRKNVEYEEYLEETQSLLDLESDEFEENMTKTIASTLTTEKIEEVSMEDFVEKDETTTGEKVEKTSQGSRRFLEFGIILFWSCIKIFFV